MSYRFPVPLSIVGRPIIYCQHCNTQLAEMLMENGRLGFVTTDGNRHECPALVERGVQRCEYCNGRIAKVRFHTFDMDGKPHGPTCVASVSKQTQQVAAPRGRANNRRLR